MARLALLAAALVLAAPAAAQPRADIGGRWATEGFASIVEFRPCAADPQTQCGRIVWLWSPNERGRPRTDARNPDAGLRSRPLLGVELVQGLRQTAPGVWTQGRLYNPDDGRTYGGSVRLKGGVLELEGCALKVVCRAQTWRRPQDVVAAAGGA
ncbi:DUF2147 domain-containing protein [Phenylobacterium sp. CCH12-B4]|uniref:DUF2147 domain-containing protein n=2 Tax=unclassified Phenylobacterium TaxID=2640670 RepID=UPI00083B9940|nr:DUF2147 domain-containing protein [Phenylobacterium sp. CCH12-B4]